MALDQGPKIFFPGRHCARCHQYRLILWENVCELAEYTISIVTVVLTDPPLIAIFIVSMWSCGRRYPVFIEQPSTLPDSSLQMKDSQSQKIRGPTTDTVSTRVDA